jgi:hypothetical protein
MPDDLLLFQLGLKLIQLTPGREQTAAGDS